MHGAQAETHPRALGLQQQQGFAHFGDDSAVGPRPLGKLWPLSVHVRGAAP